MKRLLQNLIDENFNMKVEKKRLGMQNSGPGVDSSSGIMI
jgi:hypothetical protein